MKRLCALILAAIIAGLCSAAAEGGATFGALSFTPPEGVTAQSISAEDTQKGVVYAAMSDDGRLRLVLLCQKVRKSTDTSTAALLERLAVDGELESAESVTVQGTEFALVAEKVQEGGESLYFRTATAVRNGEQLTFFVIDYDGAHAELPKRLAQSVRWSE